MFDIDKALDEIRAIDVSPSNELMQKVLHMAEKPNDIGVEKAKKLHKKGKRNNIIRFTSIAMPVAASIMIAFFALNIFTSKVSAYYTVDINPSVRITVDKSGIVSDMEFVGKQEFEMIDGKGVVGSKTSSAINNIIKSADAAGYIDKNENVLVGSFAVDNKHKKVTKNEISSGLLNESSNINLLYIEGSKKQARLADKKGISAGLISLADLVSGYDVEKEQSLDDVIFDIESKTGKSIEQILKENQKDIVYAAPKLNVSIENDVAEFSWDYIDYIDNNYEGKIVYNLVASDTEQGIMTNHEVIDEYTFEAFEAQPVDYTYLLSANAHGKYYAIVVIYEDGSRIVDADFVYVQ